MKKLLSIRLFGTYLSIMALLLQSSAMAWIGGPYSGNTYDGATGGIFSGTIRGSGTTGIFKFSQDAEPYVSAFGDSIVYHKGMAYYGECYGQVDFDGDTVSGITNGANNGSNLNDQNQSPTYRSIFGTGFGVQNGTDAGNAGTNTFGNTNAAVANSEWNGKLTSKNTTVRFQAKGEMTFFGNADNITTTINTVSTGDFNDPRFDAETGLATNPQNRTVTIGFPGTGTVVQSVTTENNYPNISDTIKINVYGTRTSTASYYPTGYAG